MLKWLEPLLLAINTVLSSLFHAPWQKKALNLARENLNISGRPIIVGPAINAIVKTDSMTANSDPNDNKSAMRSVVKPKDLSEKRKACEKREQGFV